MTAPGQRTKQKLTTGTAVAPPRVGPAPTKPSYGKPQPPDSPYYVPPVQPAQPPPQMLTRWFWLEVDAQVQGPQGPAGPIGQGADTMYGHGVTFGVNPNPRDNEAQYDQATGRVQTWDATLGGWRDHNIVDGDEYVDLDTGVVYALTTTASVPGTVPAVTAQRTWVITEEDFRMNNVPPLSAPGDVILSATGGFARIR